jgi:hypothetical protein
VEKGDERRSKQEEREDCGGSTPLCRHKPPRDRHKREREKKEKGKDDDKICNVFTALSLPPFVSLSVVFPSM